MASAGLTSFPGRNLILNCRLLQLARLLLFQIDPQLQLPPQERQYRSPYSTALASRSGLRAGSNLFIKTLLAFVYRPNYSHQTIPVLTFRVAVDAATPIRTTSAPVTSNGRTSVFGWRIADSRMHSRKRSGTKSPQLSSAADGQQAAKKGDMIGGGDYRMNKHIAIALVAGLIGGVSTRYISPTPVLAQTQSQPAKEIRAQSFTLVDQSDRSIGTFSVERVFGTPTGIRNPSQPDQVIDLSPMRIVLRDFAGRELWSGEPNGTSVRPLSLK